MLTEIKTELGLDEMPKEALLEMELNHLIRAAKIDISISQDFSKIIAAEGQIPVQEGWIKAAINVRTFARKTIHSSYVDILAIGQNKAIDDAKIVLKDLDTYATTDILPEGLLAEKVLQDKLNNFLSELQSYDYENRYIRPTRGNSSV